MKVTPSFAVFGNPIGHSKSPRIHALFARQTGIDHTYGTVLASHEEFEETLRTFLQTALVGQISRYLSKSVLLRDLMS